MTFEPSDSKDASPKAVSASPPDFEWPDRLAIERIDAVTRNARTTWFGLLGLLAFVMVTLLGVEDIVYWARELGGMKTQAFTYPHPDWRIWYFLALLVLYLCLTKVSEVIFARMMVRLSHGQATLAGEQQRKAAA